MTAAINNSTGAVVPEIQYFVQIIEEARGRGDSRDLDDIVIDHAIHQVGLSARSVYNFIEDPAHQNSTLTHLVDKLNFEDLDRLVKEISAENMSPETNAPHRLFKLEPVLNGPFSNDACVLGFVSGHVEEKILDRLTEAEHGHFQIIFDVFDRQAQTRGLAGLLFERLTHLKLSRHWKLPISFPNPIFMSCDGINDAPTFSQPSL